MSDKNKDKKWLSVKNIVVILGVSFIASLAYNFGKSIFGANIAILGVIETFVFLVIIQFLSQFFIHYRS